MSVKLTLGALFLLGQSLLGQLSFGQTSSQPTSSQLLSAAAQPITKPWQAWRYANIPVVEWDRDVAAGKKPQFDFRPDDVMHERAKEFCPKFEVDSVSGEQLYWLGELCAQAGDAERAIAADRKYIALDGVHYRPLARLTLAVQQMKLAHTWEVAWETFRSILQEDPITSSTEVQIRTAIVDEADKDESIALAWSQERYSFLLDRANSPKPGIDPVPYGWVLTAGSDLVHRYYLAGQVEKGMALLAELNQIQAEHSAEHSKDVDWWAADSLHAANMEMKPAPAIPVLKTLGHTAGTDLIKTGRVEVVHFMFLRCPPCVTDLKLLDAFEQKYKRENIFITNLTTYQAALQPDHPPHSSVEAALNEARQHRSPHSTIALSPEQTLVDYHITGYPVIAVIDKQQRVRFIGSSRGFNEGEEIDRLVRKLLEE